MNANRCQRQAHPDPYGGVLCTGESGAAVLESSRSLCRRKWLSGGIRIAYVRISAFITALLPAACRGGICGEPARPLSAADFTQTFLAESEVRQVNGFHTLKRQIDWMAGRFAVKALAVAAGIADSFPAVQVAYREMGSPYIAMRPDLAVSISHSNDWAAAGLGGEGHHALGLDIEAVRTEASAGILAAAFSPREIAELTGAGSLEVFRRWTCKEAYLKYIGMGFYESLQQVEILESGIYHRKRRVGGLRCHSAEPFPGYRLAVIAGAANGEAKPVEVSFF